MQGRGKEVEPRTQADVAVVVGGKIHGRILHGLTGSTRTDADLHPVAQADLLVTDPLSHEGGIRSGFGDGLRMERNKGETSGKGGR